MNSTQALNLPDIQTLLSTINAFTGVLKDDRRSLVKQGTMLGKLVVAKQARDKHRKHWSRLLSLVSMAEARKALTSLNEFKHKGIPSLEPLFVLEKRKLGCVIDSWLVYEFRHGRACGADCLHDIVDVLRQLHQQGYRHDDPNLGNFMRDADGQVFLLDCKGRARLGRFSDYVDFIQLGRQNADVIDASQIDALVGFDRSSFAYYLARFYLAYKLGRTAVKQRLRRRRAKHERH